MFVPFQWSGLGVVLRWTSTTGTGWSLECFQTSASVWRSSTSARMISSRSEQRNWLVWQLATGRTTPLAVCLKVCTSHLPPQLEFSCSGSTLYSASWQCWCDHTWCTNNGFSANYGKFMWVFMLLCRLTYLCINLNHFLIF